MFWLSLDLDELSSLDRSVRWFGYNRRAIVSIHDADYAGCGTGSIREKLLHLLHYEGVAEQIDRIALITVPKVCGYVFNPLNVFLCYRPDGALAALVAEVHNTFGEAHDYVLLPENQAQSAGKPIRFLTPKLFYVSPFLSVAGEYEILLTEQQDSLSLQVNLQQDGRLVFSAAMCGQAAPLNSESLAATLRQLPLLAATVMLRIHAQALDLYMRKRLRVWSKSESGSKATIAPSHPGFWHRIRAKLISMASKSPTPTPPGIVHTSIEGRF